MTVSVKVKTSTPVKAKVYWQAISADFNSPRVGYRSFRVFIEFEHQMPSAQQVLIDDFALIEWQTPFSEKPPLLISVDDKQASYIGFEKPTKAM